MKRRLMLFVMGCGIFLLVMATAGIVDGAAMLSNDQLWVLLDGLNTGWVAAYNDVPQGIGKYYLDAAVLFPERDTYLRGRDKIAGYFEQNRAAIGKIVSIQAEARYREALNLAYEFGHFVTDIGETFQYIVTWTEDGGVWRRELEVVARKTTQSIDVEGITKARQDWIRLCNQHDPKVLIENLYTSDACYYNRGRILQGRQKIAAEYGYMADPFYNLDLTPLSLVMVTADLAFEIGKCSGSYDGHYILRWRKDQDGKWRISLDANY